MCFLVIMYRGKQSSLHPLYDGPWSDHDLPSKKKKTKRKEKLKRENQKQTKHIQISSASLRRTSIEANVISLSIGSLSTMVAYRASVPVDCLAQVLKVPQTHQMLWMNAHPDCHIYLSQPLSGLPMLLTYPSARSLTSLPLSIPLCSTCL